ncbi:MAG: hypothetical protein ACFFBD_02660 [Candidatus Hodarchaeota archaeon]
MKIVFVGAGTFRFGFQLLRNFAAMAKVIPCEVWLVDINEPLLACMIRILKRITQKSKLTDNLKIDSTPEWVNALEHADAVILSISIGQQRSEWFDIHIPQKFGIPQSTGDTCGPGGVFRALRCVPVVNRLVRDMAELCPKATLFNYTNPMAPLVLGAHQTFPQIETLGICHELLKGMSVIHRYLRRLGKKDIPRWENMEIKYSGVNHFTWLFSVKYQGEDLYPLIRENVNQGKKIAERPLNFKLLKDYGYFPYAGARHIVEFIPEYYNYFNRITISKYYSPGFSKHSEVLAQINGIPKLRNVTLLERERHAVVWAYRQIAKGILPCPSPSLKGERGIEMLVDRMKSLAGTYIEEPYRYHPVNAVNKEKKIVSNLPENCVLESRGHFKDGNIQITNMGSMPTEISNLVRVHAENTPKIVDAAVSGDPDKLLTALLADPCCQFIENTESIEDMMWNMLYYEQKWLPNFKECIPSQEDLCKRKYFVTERDLKGTRRAKKTKWAPPIILQTKAHFPPMKIRKRKD